MTIKGQLVPEALENICQGSLYSLSKVIFNLYI